MFQAVMSADARRSGRCPTDRYRDVGIWRSRHGGRCEDLLGAKSVRGGPSDLGRLLVATIAAQERAALLRPPPWLEPWPKSTTLPVSLPHARQAIIFAASDEPEARARVCRVLPDEDGNMAVFGTGGAGKSACLRTLAVAAGLTMRGPLSRLRFGLRRPWPADVGGFRPRRRIINATMTSASCAYSGLADQIDDRPSATRRERREH